MTQLPESVAALERDLRDIFGRRLQSFVAYGVRAASHVQGRAGGHGQSEHEASLTHTMAVVDKLGADDLRACSGKMAAWHDAGLATPLLLAAHEFADSLGAFPLEFGAILADHVLVSGSDPFEGLQVSPADLRRACEVQARSHLLHLRQGFLETRGQPSGLAVLIVQSAAPFAGLLKSIAHMQGFASHDTGAVGRHTERTLELPGGIVTDVTRLAGVREISSTEAHRIFPTYLDAAERLVKFVDDWSAE